MTKPAPVSDADEVFARINADPPLLSLLYDADLLPEQVIGNAERTRWMVLVAASFWMGREDGQARTMRPTASGG